MFNLRTKKEKGIFDKLEEEKEMLEKENERLESEKKTLKEEVADLKLKKKISDEDIKHMVKMKQEKLDLEHEKKVIVLEREKEESIAKVKDEYRDKLEKHLKDETGNMKIMYGQILERLPNVQVRLKGEA